jgi:plastocyanin
MSKAAVVVVGAGLLVGGFLAGAVVTQGLDDDGGSTLEASALGPSQDHVDENPDDTSPSTTASAHTGEGHDATTPHNPYTPIDGCQEGENTPVAQANPSVEPEPMGAVWCYPLAPATEPTRDNGENSWVDEFNTNVQMQELNDGDFGYRVFESAGRTNDHTTRHFINNNHWMTDSSGAFTGGSSMRPDRSFTFEDGVFVIEADVASGVTEYDGDAWVEFTVTSAPEPTYSSSALYAYGQFGGHWTFGCRLEDRGHPTCAFRAPDEERNPVDRGECSATDERVLEVSSFQTCGTFHFGGGRNSDVDEHPNYRTGDFWRVCEPNQMDMMCRDRVRMELRKDGVQIFVNGVLYFEDSGWPADYQLPDEFLNDDLYAYQSEWQYKADELGNIYRFHWDHFAVNPPGPRTTSPSFCLGEPNNTCTMTMPAADSSGPASPSTEPADDRSSAEVEIVDYSFTPQDIRIEVGGEVTWTNRSTSGTAHSFTSVDEVFDSGLFEPGESVSFTFDEPGTYRYFCTAHPTMLGTITVVE